MMNKVMTKTQLNIGAIRRARTAVLAGATGLASGVPLASVKTDVEYGYLDGLLSEHGLPTTEHEATLATVANSDENSDNDESNASITGDIPDIWMLSGGRSPLLNSMQEVMLAKRVESGDQVAREAMMNANVRLVAAVARRYQGRGLPLEDLMQEGMIGLIRAIEKFNYRKGYRFSTYATHWIRQAVSRSVANQGRSIRLPAHVVDSIGRISRVREELFSKLGRAPSRTEVAEATGITEVKLTQLLKNAVQPVSLESPIGSEGESRLGDFVPADDASSPVESVFKKLVLEELETALATLAPREKDVLTLRYGLGYESAHTLEETGRRLSITRERARQIEVKALEKLRHCQTSRRLREVVN